MEGIVCNEIRRQGWHLAEQTEKMAHGITPMVAWHHGFERLTLVMSRLQRWLAASVEMASSAAKNTSATASRLNVHPPALISMVTSRK